MDDMVYTAAQHEREMTRVETQARRWFIAFIAVLCMLFTTIAGWVACEMTTHTRIAAGALSGEEGQSETDSGTEGNEQNGSEPGSV